MAAVGTRSTGLRWWREVAYVALFYGIYTAIRDTQGSAGGGANAPSATAFRHAKQVISIERHLLLFHEHQIQHYFVTHLSSLTTDFFRFWDIWYGGAHFVVTAAVVIWLFLRQPTRYRFWRNTLAVMTSLALIGFAAYPLMPPRLLPYDAYGFVDTLARYGGSWSFDSGAMTHVSNQFAAMPSLHIGWSTWSACAVYPACRRAWTRALAVAYPWLTLFCIVVTANHFFLDALAGVLILVLGMAIARPVTDWAQRWMKATEDAATGVQPAT